MTEKSFKRNKGQSYACKWMNKCLLFERKTFMIYENKKNNHDL